MFTLVDFANIIGRSKKNKNSQNQDVFQTKKIFSAQEEHLLIEKPHNPFEKIKFWQFLQILIILSWNLYGQYVHASLNILRHETVDDFLQYYESHHEKLALTRAFHYFMENDLLREKPKADSGLLPLHNCLMFSS